MIPLSTYRLQLRREFGFDDAARIAPYLSRLGASLIYVSPILTARAGSAHGYDVTDPTRVNPELGGEDGLRHLVAVLRREGMGLIVDIVPNHMAVGAENPWWRDVLERGEASIYARHFDIDWRCADPALCRRLALPFLGAPYGDVLRSGDLRLAFDLDLGRLVVAYHEHRFPLRTETYTRLLKDAGIGDLASAFERATDATTFEDARRDLAAHADRLAPVLERHSRPKSLHALLEDQHWRLAWWRTAADEINWRRFFEITGLVGLRVEDPAVFEDVHATTLRLFAEGMADGVRIDHVDGLADPGAYLQRLRTRLDMLAAQRPPEARAGQAYLIVEKILASEERLPADWPIDGATGYEFMNEVSGLLHNPAGESALSEMWRDVSGRSASFADEELAARRELLASAFPGQHEAASAAFHKLARARVETRDITRQSLHRALTEILVRFPSYRTYAGAGSARELDEPVPAALKTARKAAGPDAPAADFIAERLSGPASDNAEDWRTAVVRLQQLSAPLAAKAVEDTAFYRHGRLLSRNDVGSDPGEFALSLEWFHARCERRVMQTPNTLLATATHDHKRGEDVRARLAVLSELPEEWIGCARRWLGLARQLAPSVDASDAYQLLQTLAGAWPLDLVPQDALGLNGFADRIAAWQEKSLREQKLRSSWTGPDTDYEGACDGLVRRLLDPAASKDFLAEFSHFVDRIAPAGGANGLVQAFLRCVTPGVPDTYQGCEFWDFSLVDPDNRRPVDYPARERALDSAAEPSSLAGRWRDGRVKQALLSRLLHLRQAAPDLFREASYEPLGVAGRRASNVVAFARRKSDAILVAFASRLIAPALLDDKAVTPEAQWWDDTVCHAPGGAGASAGIDAQGDRWRLATVLDRLPVALFLVHGGATRRVL